MLLQALPIGSLHCHDDDEISSVLGSPVCPSMNDSERRKHGMTIVSRIANQSASPSKCLAITTSSTSSSSFSPCSSYSSPLPHLFFLYGFQAALYGWRYKVFKKMAGRHRQLVVLATVTRGFHKFPPHGSKPTRLQEECRRDGNVMDY